MFFSSLPHHFLGVRARLVILKAALFLSLLSPDSQAKSTSESRATLSKQDMPSLSWLTKRADTSFAVMRLSDQKIIASHDASSTLTSASVMKIATSLAVMNHYPPYYKIKTPVYTTGTRNGDTVAGDLVIVGRGDPYLISEKLWQFAADIRNSGIRKITGNIVIDNSFFRVKKDAARLAAQKRSRNAYDAPVSALGINFNTVALAIAPGANAGEKALLTTDPVKLDGVQVVNNIKTTSKGRNGFRVDRVSILDGVALQTNGKIRTDSGLKKVYRSVSDPVLLAGSYLKAFLAQVGVNVEGKAVSGYKPAAAKHLMDIEGYPISKLIRGLNKYSNNYIADTLTSRLGAEFAKNPTISGGMSVVQQFLRNKVGVQDGTYLNGSGLDPQNKLSAASLVKMLSYAYARMEMFPEFLASLPNAGHDGSLRDRYKKRDTKGLAGILRAKTGTLTQPRMVSSLAGYFFHPRHGYIAFAVLNNGKKETRNLSIVDLRYRQDKLLAEVYSKL
jgi:D-alanyl-D-alanine carboxypeptidase/D-alanyl-D-alanine-endopeptidase (penicillin-binding protein 4)